MADQPTQKFENHVTTDRLLMAAGIIYFTAISIALVGIFVSGPLVHVAVVLACLAGFIIGVRARVYAVTVQDRVVRLEMRLRLREVLPQDLAGRASEFTLGQLIGLRFASDAELPELARKVLQENITDGTTIKKLVKDWQPDFQRV